MNGDRIENLQAEYRCLISDLSSNNCDYGDWKLIKQSEFSAQGLPLPYTEEEMAEYHEKRQWARNRINEIEKELEELMEEVN